MNMLNSTMGESQGQLLFCREGPEIDFGNMGGCGKIHNLVQRLYKNGQAQKKHFQQNAVSA